MKNHLRYLVLILTLVLNLTSCRKDDEGTPVPPTITSFAPQSGAVGKTVIITGTNFSTTANENTVTFHEDISATVTAATATTLTVTVPTKAETGKIAVAVNGQHVASEDDFTVIPPPTITSFSPQSGIVGTTVTVTGTNFSTTSNENIVTFHEDISATVTAATATVLTITVPSGAETGKIAVTVNGQNAASEDDFTVNEVPSKGVFRKGDKVYLLNEEIMYNGKKITFEKDSILAAEPTQEVYHFLKKQDNVFYLVEIRPSRSEGNQLSIINNFNRPQYDDANYLRTDLRKLPLPFTEYSYGAADRQDRQIYAVKQIVDSKGFINKAAISRIAAWEEVAKKTVGSVVRMEGGGSGWFIDKDLILTNQHVVGDIMSNGDYTVNRELEVRLFDGRVTKGRTWFTSQNHDVALVKLNQSFDDVNLLSLSNSTALRGELILNIGGPNIAETYGSHLAILGVVDRSFSFILEQRIHISATSGQSGSPVFNARGEVLGMMARTGPDVTIREDVNYNEVSSSSTLIYADSEVIETPYVGPTSSDMVSNETMLRLVSFWLKMADRKLPDQRLKLTNTYTWNAASEEFYAKYDIGFPYDQIPEINKKVTPMLKSIVTVQQRLSDPQSRISTETAVVYDQDYLIGLSGFPYEVGDVMNVISYDRKVRQATIIAIKTISSSAFRYYLYQLKSSFDEGGVTPVKGKTAEVKSSEPLLTLGRGYHYPYPGSFQINPVMYENEGIKHQNGLTTHLPLFNLGGEFIGYSPVCCTEGDSFNKESRLFIRSVIPVASPVRPLKLEKAASIFSHFSQLK